MIDSYVFFRFILQLDVVFRDGRPIHLLDILGIAVRLVCEALLVLSLLLPLLFQLSVFIDPILVKLRLVVLYSLGGLIGEGGGLAWIVRCYQLKAASFQAEFFTLLSDHFFVFSSVARYFVL